MGNPWDGGTLPSTGLDLDVLADRVVWELRRRISFEVEASGRHVHLSAPHVEALFGPGVSLSPERPLSQPGQFLCVQRVTLVGPKGEMRNVAVLGPERPRTQVEVSVTDALSLGISPPVRDSGDVEGSASLVIRGPMGEVKLSQGVIVAHRHVHMPPEDAVLLGV